MDTEKDCGIKLEMALRSAVKCGKDFERFADIIRSLCHNDRVSRDDAQNLIIELAEKIQKWPNIE